MKKILLTGGNGFIGKNIQESPLAQKYEIFAPRSGELNLINTDCVDDYFKNKSFDVVLHAGVKPGHRNAKNKNDLFYSNLRMFENLERHKDKYEKFINFGSGAIYDTSKDISCVKESDIFKNVPSDEHGFCKYVEHKQIENLSNFIDLNIFGIFGKYEDFEIRFISNAICKAIFGLPITIRQNRRFSYLFVDDLIPILEFFIENKPQFNSYNIVPDEKTELKQIAQVVQKLSGKDIGIIADVDGFGLEYSGDNSRLKKEYTDAKFTNIVDAVKVLYEYYECNKDKIDVNLLKEDK